MKINSDSIRAANTTVNSESAAETVTPRNPETPQQASQNAASSTKLATSMLGDKAVLSSTLATQLHATVVGKNLESAVVKLTEQLHGLLDQKKAILSQMVAVRGEIQALELAATQGSGNPALLSEKLQQLDELKKQMGEVESQIQSVMQQIEDLQNKESDQTSQPSSDGILENLKKSSKSASEMTKAIRHLLD